MIRQWGLTPFCVLLLVLSVLSPMSFAEPEGDMGDNGQEGSVVQAQTTLASLFPAGAKMPELPQMEGTVAVPSFDSKNILSEEKAVKKTEG